MLRMTSIAASRLVLVGPGRAARGRDSAAVRRFRLARLRVEGERKVGRPPYDHLKRVYD
jgi:hypothetical protein